MAVKTITIDMEAYERLHALKTQGMSFSEVIKEVTATYRKTASALLEDSAQYRFSDDSLDMMDRVVAEREADYPRIPGEGA